MNCPIDNSPLVPQKHRSMDMHMCYSCRGVWVGETDLHGHVKNRNALKLAQTATSRPTQRGRHIRLLNCPRCEQRPMIRRNIDDIEVDICRSCNHLWLDAGELEAIVHWHRKRQQKMGLAGIGAAGIAATGMAAAAAPLLTEERKASLLERSSGGMEALELGIDLVEMGLEITGAVLEFACEVLGALF